MRTEFEVGKYYRWIGPPERPRWFNSDGYMDYMLDGKAHLCVISHRGMIAGFEEDTINGKQAYWYWWGLHQYFEEADPVVGNQYLLIF